MSTEDEENEFDDTVLWRIKINRYTIEISKIRYRKR